MNQPTIFERIVKSLNEATLDDTRWPQASALIDQAFGAKGNVLTFGEGTFTGNVEIYFMKCFYQGEDRSAWQRDYFQNYYADDEHIPRMRALPDSTIIPVADLFSEGERKASRMYNEALVRRYGQRGLSIRLDGPQGSRIAWGIADPIHASGWSSAQIDVIAHVLPHLRQYVTVRTAFIEAGAINTSLTELLDNTGLGVIQLSSGGRIVGVNDRAQELLRQNDGLSDRKGELRAAFPKDDDKLQELLAQALPPPHEQGTSGSMIVKRLSLLPHYAVHIKPVTNQETNERSRQVATLVLVADPTNRAIIDRALVQSVLGLTPTETEIAVLLTEGRAAPQIAAATGRSYSTVRTHLRHIFGKLGVSRQIEVAQLVLALSSLPKPRISRSSKIDQSVLS